MRKEAREAAFKIVFADQFGGDTGAKFRSEIYKKSGLKEDDVAFAEEIVSLSRAHRDEIVDILTQKVQNYAENRIYPVDRAILMVALTEIKYIDNIPPVISVNEAVGLARVYSTEQSVSFVNGVLAGVINP